MVKLVSNPPNPFLEHSCEYLDVPEATLEVFEEQARSIITKNESPDIAFRYSVNPYRGCFHACAYCYARPTHQYIDFGAGTDFERKIVVKTNAPQLLRQELQKRSWSGDGIAFSGVTDCYQPLEGSYQLTRQCLEICRNFENPVTIITKSLLIRRDIELLKELNRVAGVEVFFSIAFADDALSKALEPGAPRPSRRFDAVRVVAEAGIPVGIGVAPVIPGLTEEQIVPILEQGREAGASKAFMTLLRLPMEVKDVFFERIRQAVPEREKKIDHAIREMKGGALNRSEFKTRMVGSGSRWDAVNWIFESTCKRLGYNEPEGRSARTPKRRSTSAQLSLFGNS